MLKEARDGAFELVHVTTVRDAVGRLTAQPDPHDIVLLDLSLPDESGLETVRRIAEFADRASIVVMTGAGDEQMGIAATKAGAQDYLVKGQVDGRILRRALRLAFERHELRRQLLDQSITDDLTGLQNRRGFLEFGDSQLRLAGRSGATCLMFFLDLDGLKQINDTFGHGEGNRALVEAASVLRASFRRTDLLARIGGDEFAGLIVDATVDAWPALRARMEQILERVNAVPDRPYRIEFSVGMVACPPSEDPTLEGLLNRADECMYDEKRRKKRRP
jgi:diguanylate cyclase (GGDEF)-like protein